MQLSDDFIQYTRQLFGSERFERFMQALDEELLVSIRLNPKRFSHAEYGTLAARLDRVPWCQNGFYLPTRPNFTFDPLLHAGCYYVQEASSMFLDEVLRQHLPSLTIDGGLQTTDGLKTTDERLKTKDYRALKCLDLCAAPGGKSTLMRSVLPENSVLYSNEPMHKRASVLLENVEKWGYENHFVTNLYPKDYRKSKMKFDVILCDVPCSGEGMFRKDSNAASEWSTQNVEKCWQLQREIVADAWQCLADGGLLIYSTCTFNTKENEENVRWIMEELGAEVLPVATKSEWGITGSLLEGFNEPVYRFIPGYTRGEGLFMAVLRKGPVGSVNENETAFREPRNNSKGKVPTLERLNGDAASVQCPIVDLDYAQAIAYLRGEAITLPAETPRGIVNVSFMGHVLGQVKNIGSRANNLYPKEWRIKTTHVPQQYEPVICSI